MAMITSKELSAISDLLTMEETVCAKYSAYAKDCTDTRLKDLYENLASSHQRHFDELYANLK